MEKSPLTKTIHLQHLSEDNKLIEAIFAPESGMNLMSFKKDGLELIDQATKPDFIRRFAGLGALIGPHFYHRAKDEIPSLDADTFPHIATLKDLKETDPLSHGIGRYVSWNYDETSSSISAHLCGLDTHKGKTLASLEGFNFKLNFNCHLTSRGLEIKYHVEGDMHPTTIGLHYYLSLPDKKGFVSMETKEHYNDMGTLKQIPDEWLETAGKLKFDLKNESDFGFFPNSEDNKGSAILSTPSHSLKISYEAKSEQNAFQLYHPKGASFVCIEPVSAKDPRAPIGTDHTLYIKLEVL